MATLMMWNCLNTCVPEEEYFDYPVNLAQLGTVPAPPSVGTKLKKTLETRPPSAKKEPSPEQKKFNEIAGGKASVAPDLAAHFIRTLGEAPSNADIAELYQRHGQGVSADAALSWRAKLHDREAQTDHADMLSRFFQAFDPTGSGKLTALQMRTLLTTYGDALTDDEAQAILEYAFFFAHLVWGVQTGWYPVAPRDRRLHGVLQHAPRTAAAKLEIDRVLSRSVH